MAKTTLWSREFNVQDSTAQRGAPKTLSLRIDFAPAAGSGWASQEIECGVKVFSKKSMRNQKKGYLKSKEGETQLSLRPTATSLSAAKSLAPLWFTLKELDHQKSSCRQYVLVNISGEVTHKHPIFACGEGRRYLLELVAGPALAESEVTLKEMIKTGDIDIHGFDCKLQQTPLSRHMLKKRKLEAEKKGDGEEEGDEKSSDKAAESVKEATESAAAAARARRARLAEILLPRRKRHQRLPASVRVECPYLNQLSSLPHVFPCHFCGSSPAAAESSEISDRSASLSPASSSPAFSSPDSSSPDSSTPSASDSSFSSPSDDDQSHADGSSYLSALSPSCPVPDGGFGSMDGMLSADLMSSILADEVDLDLDLLESPPPCSSASVLSSSSLAYASPASSSLAYASPASSSGPVSAFAGSLPSPLPLSSALSIPISTWPSALPSPSSHSFKVEDGFEASSEPNVSWTHPSDLSNLPLFDKLKESESVDSSLDFYFN